jgi:hypothetical protein
VFLIDSNPTGTYDAFLTMRAFKQPASFPAPANGSVSVLSLDGVSPNCPPGMSGSGVELDLLQWGAAGSSTVSGDLNDCGTASLNPSNPSTYSIASNGRVTTNYPGHPHPPVFYLVNSTEGFLVGTNTAKVQSGFFELQVGSNFSNASLVGNYFFGTQPLVVNGGDVGVGIATLDGTGNVTGTSDYNDGGTITTDTFTDTLSVAASGRATTSETVIYVISPSKLLMIDGGHSNFPKVGIIEK